MPFVTEELWQRLPRAEGPQPPSIMTAPFPTLQEHWKSATAEETMESLLEVVRATRGLRAGGLGCHGWICMHAFEQFTCLCLMVTNPDCG